jgi:uncharacterized protein
MRINLSDIIDMPGKEKSFSCPLDAERLESPAIAEFLSPPLAEGAIKNTAGALNLTARIKAELSCHCDRCGTLFRRDLDLPVEAKLAADLVDGDNPDIFPLDGDELDVSDVLETCFILEADTKFLCKENCAGLCARCGKNLNDGPCSCPKEIDPRLAVLQQLLDK